MAIHCQEHTPDFLQGLSIRGQPRFLSDLRYNPSWHVIAFIAPKRANAR